MNYMLKRIGDSIGLKEYEMYQDIPTIPVRYNNKIYGLNYEEYLSKMNEYIENETISYDDKLGSSKNVHIFYVDNVPTGEISIRTLKNQFWEENGSQIFYAIRSSMRNKGYGTIMLGLALQECKKLGFNQVGVNCDDTNIGSKKMIIANGGKLLKSYVRSDGGNSSRYRIKLD